MSLDKLEQKASLLILMQIVGLVLKRSKEIAGGFCMFISHN